ncbi:hypothetical protein B0H13DRAFT_1493563, partial [Mycena leptocephala]
NITIVAPAGTSQHGHNNLLCVPTRALGILVFFSANYVAHAATVKSYPGESSFDYTWAAIAAFLLPTSGMLRGFSAILRVGGIMMAIRERGGPLEIAARCGALSMVVRTRDWKPAPGDQLT